jgi:hypothetical protein
MEDLQSLMSCLDEISDTIGDGMYLSMADKLKRIHNKLNGDKPFHEDSFYYSDDDSELGSDDDSDYSYPASRSPVHRDAREISVDIIRDHLLDYLQSMHQVWADMQKLDVDLKKLNPLITRMTAARKQRAIQRWCEKNTDRCPGGTAGDLIGCGPIVIGSIFWSWKNLIEHGLHAILMEIGTEEEIEKAKRLNGSAVYRNMHCDDLSLATLKKLPAFEKKIYDDYKREYNEKIVQRRDEIKAKSREREENMQRWETCARGEEDKLRALGAHVYDRDRWDAEARDFWVDDVNGRMVNGP